MAKAKKSEPKQDAAESTAPKASAKKKAPAKSKAATASPGTPLIDTNLAAQAAAKMVANRDAASFGAASDEKSTESSSFKQLKQNLNKPNIGGLGGLLGGAGSEKKSHLPFGGGKQVGRNQTFGADVNRSNLPRRTGG